MNARHLLAADLLCGAGGTTTGLLRAAEQLGCTVELHGVNHDPLAIETIRANHPNGKYFCENIETTKPEEVVPGRHLDIVVASPECVFFSRARGGLPKNDQSRAIAMSIVNWVQRLTVDRLLVENVPEFVDWGPLYPDCNCGLGLEVPPEKHPKHCHWMKPIPEKKGKNFIAWINALKAADYTVQWKILNCADYGDPTTRQRFFLLGKRGRKRIHWPEPTHSRNPDPRLFGSVKPWRTAREIIDWSLPGESVFNRKRPLSPNTMKRIMAGLRKYSGLEFVLPNPGAPSAEPGSIDEPMPSLNGTGVALLQPFVIGQQTCAAPRDVDQPLPTVAGAGAISLVNPFLVMLNGTTDTKIASSVRSVDAPVPTIVGTPHAYLAQPFIIGAGGPEGAGRPQSLEKPLGTVLTDDHRALVEPFILNIRGGDDGYMRGASVDEPVQTVTGSPAMALIEPFILPPEGIHRGNAPRSVDQPLPTVTASRGAGHLVEPFIVQMDNGGSLQSVDDPLRTVTSADGRALVEPFLVEFHGTGPDGRERVRSVADPMPTVPASPIYGLAEPFIVACNHGPAERATSLGEPMKTVTSVDAWGLVQPFVINYNGTGHAHSIDEPLNTVATRDRFALVVVLQDGRRALLDIRFRMLQPHELARAQGFPEGYTFTGSRERKVKLIGNAVPCNTATALCLSLLS